jgi:hypothetical protein
MFQTNVFGGTYQRHTNPVSWTFTGVIPEGVNIVNVTNCPWITPSWYSQTQHLHQISHTNTVEVDLGENGTVNVVTVTTNDSKIKLYTGIADDSTRPHLFRLNVRVWNTVDPDNETEYPASTIRLLTQTPNEAGDIYIVRNDNVHEDVTPSVVGVADNDVKFTVTPEKLKVRFYAQAGKLAHGYDPMPTNKVADHWTSLAVGGTNEITELRIPGDWATNRIELKVTGPISLSQTNGFSTQVTPLTIVSTGGADEATIEAVDNVTYTTLAVLKVLILPLRIVPVGIFRITDPDSEDTALGDTDSNESIIATLNQIFRQANVQFYDNTLSVSDGAYADGVSLNYDINVKEGYYDNPDNTVEYDLIADWVDTIVGTNLLPILMIKEWGIPYPITNLPSSLRSIRGAKETGPLRTFIFTEASQGVQSLVGAHEAGHALGLHHWPNDNAGPILVFPQDNSQTVEHLMRPGSPWFWPTDPEADMSDTSNWVVPFPGQWLDKESWQKVNDKANELFP